MARRLELLALLESLMDPEHVGNVYYQPPPTVKLSYPAIIYSKDSARTDFADGIPYIHSKRWQIMIISQNPDDPLPDKVARLPKCLFASHYTVQNLYHDVYNLYF